MQQYRGMHAKNQVAHAKRAKWNYNCSIADDVTHS